MSQVEFSLTVDGVNFYPQTVALRIVDHIGLYGLLTIHREDVIKQKDIYDVLSNFRMKIDNLEHQLWQEEKEKPMGELGATVKSDRQAKHTEILEALAHVSDSIESLRRFSEAIDDSPSPDPPIAGDRGTPNLYVVLTETPQMLHTMGKEIMAILEDLRTKLY